MPTRLAQRGRTLVVSVSSENDFCSVQLGKECLESLGRIDEMGRKAGRAKAPGAVRKAEGKCLVPSPLGRGLG